MLISHEGSVVLAWVHTSSWSALHTCIYTTFLITGFTLLFQGTQAYPLHKSEIFGGHNQIDERLNSLDNHGNHMEDLLLKILQEESSPFTDLKNPGRSQTLSDVLNRNEEDLMAKKKSGNVKNQNGWGGTYGKRDWKRSVDIRIPEDPTGVLSDELRQRVYQQWRERVDSYKRGQDINGWGGGYGK